MEKQETTLDIGCGNNKIPGSFGIDVHPFEGVDRVVNLETPDWPLEDSRFDRIVARHVIEHIEDTANFLKEIHRVGKPDAIVEIETPHFSSINSWIDPTHKKHYSAKWYILLEEGYYLSSVTGRYEMISSEVTFGKSFRNKIGSMMVKMFGLEKWEKNSAFTFPGMDIKTRLRIKK